jgi:hypothetical protein
VVGRSNGLRPLGRPSHRLTGPPPTAARHLMADPKDVSQRGPCPGGILWRLRAGRWKEYPMAYPDRRTALLESYENAAAIVSGIADEQVALRTPCPGYDVRV